MPAHGRSPHTARSDSALATGVKTLLGTTLGLAGGWIAYSALVIDHCVPLPNAIQAPHQTLSGPATGMMSSYVERRGDGRPLVLIHSINAAASAYEMKPLFEHYRASRPIFALDLPGFGFSERSARIYSPQLYTDAVLELLRSITDGPADVVALSLGSEFAARAALAHPELFHSLTMISPSGFSRKEGDRASQKASERGTSSSIYKLLSFPLWARALYDLIATRRSINFFLKQSFSGPVPEDLADYAYATSHQPGAHYAPLYFLSGELFTRDVRDIVYELLTIPVLVIYDRDAFVSFDLLPLTLERHDNWRAARISPTRGLPQFERLPDTTQALDRFWEPLS